MMLLDISQVHQLVHPLYFPNLTGLSKLQAYAHKAYFTVASSGTHTALKLPLVRQAQYLSNT